MAWTRSTRQQPSRTATSEWKRIRQQATTELDYRCQHANQGRCAGPLELDHIRNHKSGGTNTLDNLQWLCHTHHTAKTQREAAATRRAKLAAARYPTETHPGLRTTTPTTKR